MLSVAPIRLSRRPQARPERQWRPKRHQPPLQPRRPRSSVRYRRSSRPRCRPPLHQHLLQPESSRRRPHARLRSRWPLRLRRHLLPQSQPRLRPLPMSLLRHRQWPIPSHQHQHRPLLRLQRRLQRPSLPLRLLPFHKPLQPQSPPPRQQPLLGPRQLPLPQRLLPRRIFASRPQVRRCRPYRWRPRWPPQLQHRRPLRLPSLTTSNASAPLTPFWKRHSTVMASAGSRRLPRGRRTTSRGSARSSASRAVSSRKTGSSRPRSWRAARKRSSRDVWRVAKCRVPVRSTTRVSVKRPRRLLSRLQPRRCRHARG